MDNPWPPNTGDLSWITYDEYVSGDDHVHWIDYYEITYGATDSAQGGVVNANADTEDTQGVNEMSVSLESGFKDDPTSAASDSLKLFTVLVTLENAKKMGFDDGVVETSDLSLGQPFPVFYIRHDALAERQEGSEVKELLQDRNEMLFPVRKAGKLVSSITVTRKNGGWAFKSLGNANLIKDLVEVRNKNAAGSGRPKSEYFIVHVPSMYHIFVGHYDASGKLRLTYVHDEPEHEFRKGGTDDGQDVIDRISINARLNRQALPQDAMA